MLASKLYSDHCPKKWKNRRNFNHSKMSDVEILALFFLQIRLKMHSQREFWDYIKCFLPKKAKIERSRFNRRVKQLLPLMIHFRQKLLQLHDIDTEYGIVDSFPIPLCQSVRNFRAKIFREHADIGYNATKKIHFYGFKAHIEVTLSGYITNYVISKASLSDPVVVTELIVAGPSQKFLADVGYVGKDRQNELRKLGYDLWTPYRPNMKGAKEHNDHFLMRIRRTIETRISVLNSEFQIETNRARSLVGFQVRFEVAILLYNLGYFDIITN